MRKKIANSGIYLIQNSLTKQAYVGQSKNIKVRIKQHLRCLRNGNHPNKKLQNSWNSYTESDFKISTLQNCDIEFLTSYEIKYYEYYKTLPAGIYNLMPPGTPFTHTEDANQRQSKRQTGIKMKYYPGVYEEKVQLLRSFNEKRKGKPGKKPTEEDKRKALLGQIMHFPDAYRITNNYTGQSWVFLTTTELERVTGLSSGGLLAYNGKIPKEITRYCSTLIWSIE